jgi:hypothetical protein
LTNYLIQGAIEPQIGETMRRFRAEPAALDIELRDRVIFIAADAQAMRRPVRLTNEKQNCGGHE